MNKFVFIYLVVLILLIWGFYSGIITVPSFTQLDQIQKIHKTSQNTSENNSDTTAQLKKEDLTLIQHAGAKIPRSQVMGSRYLHTKSLCLNGGAPLPMGLLTRDISDGNPISWSNYDNPRYPTGYEKLPIDIVKHPKATGLQLVIQGHGVPLSYEEKGSSIVDNSMFYFNRHKASPDCCPSTYSTDRGCVC